MWKVFKKNFKEFSKWYLIFFYTVRYILPKNSETKLHIIFLVPKNAKEIFFPRIFKYFGYKHAKKNIKCYFINLFVNKKNYFKV